MSRDPLSQRRTDAIESLDQLGGRGVQVNRSGGSGRLPGGRFPFATFRSRAGGIDQAALLAERRIGRRIGFVLGRDRADRANSGAQEDYGCKKEESFALGWRGHAEQ